MINRLQELEENGSVIASQESNQGNVADADL
jgi:hypothetical protein